MIPTTKSYINYGFGLREFQDYGINFLTGEACGYGGRILADLDFAGVALMERFLGTTIKHGNGWNDCAKESASMMIPRGMIADLAVYCLIDVGYQLVVMRPGYVALGMSMEEWMAEDDEGMAYRDRYFKAYPECKVYVNTGTAGARNRHEFTGRVE